MNSSIIMILILNMWVYRSTYIRSVPAHFTYTVKWMYSYDAQTWKNWDTLIKSDSNEIWFMGLFALTYPPDTFSSIDITFTKNVSMDLTLNDLPIWYNKKNQNSSYLIKSSNKILRDSHNTLIFHQHKTNYEVNFTKPVLASNRESGCFSVPISSVLYIENFTVTPSYAIKLKFYKKSNFSIYSSISQILIEMINPNKILTSKLNIFGGMQDYNLTLLYIGDIATRYSNNNLNYTERIFAFYVIEFIDWNETIYKNNIKNITLSLCSTSGIIYYL